MCYTNGMGSSLPYLWLMFNDLTDNALTINMFNIIVAGSKRQYNIFIEKKEQGMAPHVSPDSYRILTMWL